MVSSQETVVNTPARRLEDSLQDGTEQAGEERK